jgi:hypothetical protein
MTFKPSDELMAMLDKEEQSPLPFIGGTTLRRMLAELHEYTVEKPKYDVRTLSEIKTAWDSIDGYVSIECCMRSYIVAGIKETDRTMNDRPCYLIVHEDGFEHLEFCDGYATIFKRGNYENAY